jgi:hypothetical protein
MTQRYAHLRDETLQKASNVAADLFKPPKNPTDVEVGRMIRFDKK